MTKMQKVSLGRQTHPYSIISARTGIVQSAHVIITDNANNLLLIQLYTNSAKNNQNQHAIMQTTLYSRTQSKRYNHRGSVQVKQEAATSASFTAVL